VTPKPSTTAGGASSGGGIQTERGNFRATVVTLPISAQMVTDTASDSDCANDCPTKSLADFVSQNGGYAGINGSYFCPSDYADCASKKNSFDFSVYNSRLSKWINQGQLSWNGRSMIYRDGGGYHYMQNANGFGGGLSAGIVNYPGILNNGQITVEANQLSEKQAAKGTKGGMGFNGSNIFLVVAYGVDMSDFAAVFKALGAQYALNLDGGGSAALYNGGYKAGPGRALPNAIIFK
jgi:exopolysaccharide biosynthesis protein